MPDRRTLATCAALGLLAGGLLVVVVTLLAGPRISLGLGWLWRSGARPYPYHLLDAGGVHPALLPLLPVALGVGLLAGLLVACGGRFLRGTRPAVWPVAGVAVGLLLALGTHVWRWDGPADSENVVYHGRYVPLRGITASRAYGSTLDIVDAGGQSWWPLVLTGAVVGLVAGLLVLAATHRRIRASTWPSG
ncbi:hypothetical protein [uncultured Jatrophihabitans sp.]|uniref:hypothetical protein n=1 Tax=uncultured Jatrophihabitans sp. TaxID=1610747 RepID=UPI0035CA3BD7